MKTSTMIILAVFALALSTYGQHAGKNDFTFNPIDTGFGKGLGNNNYVVTTSIQSNSKIIIAGSFTSYNGTPSNQIARLNVDGTLDTSFNPGTGTGANSSINTISIQTDGKIIIGGLFTSYNNITRNNIARLNADGTLDTSFNPGTGTNERVETTSIQSDGKIIIGGLFTSYNGTTTNHIARLNTDGTLDTSFNLGTGASNGVRTTSIQSDGKIIIGGYFSSYNGTSRSQIARLNTDGSLDTSFNPGTGAIGYYLSNISIQSDGKIIIAGAFTSYNGTNTKYIARLNADGTLDSNFNQGTGLNSAVNTTSIQSDGKIIIGGYFSTYNGVAVGRISRLNSDGTLDTSFNPETGIGIRYDDYFFSTSIQSDGKIIIVGTFTSYNGTGNLFTRLNSNGTFDTSFNPGTGANRGRVRTTSIQNDGKTIIGGNFTSYNGTLIRRFARLNADGTLDNNFNSGTGVSGSYVYTNAIQNDEKIIIGGDFISYNGTMRKNIARLNADGTLDSSFNPGTGTDWPIRDISIQSDGKIIIGGGFTSYNGTTRNRIARLNTDGTLDTTFNPGTGANQFVYTTSIQNDGKIIIGGWFSSFNGTTTNYIARLNTDGTLDSSFNMGTGANGIVYVTSIQSDGKIIIGGEFTSYNGIMTNHIARLNKDGTLDTSFNLGTGANGYVYTTSIQSDGKIIIGGDFTSFNGTIQSRIARLNADGTLDNVFDSGIGADGAVTNTSIQSDGKIIVGGTFISYNGAGRNSIARIYGGVQLSNPIFEKESIVIYPNPVKDILNLSLIIDGIVLDKVTIVDITGKEVLKQTQNLSAINVEQLTNGFYVLTAYTKEKIYHTKFIKE